MNTFLSSDVALATDVDMDRSTVPELNFSDYISASTTTSEDEYRQQQGCNWNQWSPLVNWDTFTGGQDDFQDLVESMMMNDVNVSLNPDHCHAINIDDDEEEEEEEEEEGTISNSGALTELVDATMVDEESSSKEEDVDHDTGDDFKGLRLIHLLIAAAEALAGVNIKSRDMALARVILVRLKEIVSPIDGNNMERLAAYFTDALQALLDGAQGNNNNNNNIKNFINSNGPYREDHHHQIDVLAAFQLLQDMSPYVKFGHFTANQAILEAVAHEKRVHIVDYDIMEGIQWASFMQALVSKKDGPPTPHLRITAISRGGGGKKSIATVQETGRRLTAFAASISQPFSFHQCRLDSDETFRPSSLKLVKGEVLVFNCMLHLPHFSYRSPTSVASFLRGAKSLNPRLVTLVEEEVGPIGDSGFVGRFMDLLHHYSAVYDSLEAGFPMQNRARALVERVFIGPRITGSLGRVYRNRGEEMEKGSWGEWLGSGIGLKGVGISYANHCQAKLLLGLFNDGYKVEEMGSNKLILGWKSRRLLSASLWSSSSSSSLSSSSSSSDSDSNYVSE